MNETKLDRPSLLVEIEKLVYGGEGLSRIDGQILLLPYVLPGEKVSAQAIQVKKGLLRANQPTVVSPSPERTAPGCEYFGTCGGCHYQHANYGLQLTAKRSILLETLTRLGGIQFSGDVETVSADPWHYRNRVQLHFTDRRMGFRRAGSHELCAIDHCPISSGRLNEVIASLSAAVQQRPWPAFLRTLEVFTNENDVQLTISDSARPIAARFFDWCSTFVPGYASGPIDYRAANFTFRISRGSFFQVNRFLIDALVAQAIGEVQGDSAWDLYAGVGLFTLPLSDCFRHVNAVERSGPAFRDLEWNVRDRAERIHIFRQTAEEFLHAQQSAPDLVLADPPRAGIGPAVTDALMRLRSRDLVIVSCDPATLARDLKKLLEIYDIHRLVLLDLFPQTYHFETIAALKLRNGSSNPQI